MRPLILARILALAAAFGSTAATGTTTADDRGKAPAKPAQTDADVQQRVRELVYVLRHYRLHVRVEEWTGALRELTRIGKPAVPELVAELNRTNRMTTVRGLAFALRVIGDRRAIPALIRALDTNNIDEGRGDDGVSLPEPQLMAFMQDNQCTPGKINGLFTYGGPASQVAAALSKMTKREEPEYLESSKRQPFWKDWWTAHQNEFITEQELATLQPSGKIPDRIEEAGLAHFGPLFVTGRDVRLGPVREAQLEFSDYRDSHCWIDLESGRLYQWREGITAAEAKSEDFLQVQARWRRRTGVDAYCHTNLSGDDLQLWLIDNDRWDTLESEIDSGRPLNLGREITTDLLRSFGKNERDFRPNAKGTFLFITREGTRGVIQVFPRDSETYSRRICYRMWVAGGPGAKQSPAPAPPPKRRQRNEAEWGPERVVVLLKPARGRAFLLNLETGKRESPPDSLVPAELPERYVFADGKELAAWCRVRGVNIGVVQESPIGPRLEAPEAMLSLVGLDMNAVPVSPQSYNEISLTELKELAARWPQLRQRVHRWPPHPDQTWMQIGRQPRRDTYIIATNSGTFGVLQIQAARGGIAFRYRLAKDAGQNN